MLRYNDEEYELYCNSDPSWRASAASRGPCALPAVPSLSLGSTDGNTLLPPSS